MTLNIDGKQVNQLIINKNAFTYEGVWVNMTSAAEHNAKLGGTSLGAFNDDFAQRIKSGSFTDLWVGDYFTVNGHKYKIAGFNYKAYHEENKELGNHLIMLTDVLGTHVMNSSNTTAGGFAGSSMFKDEIPVVENQLAADFGSHLLPFKSYLSTSFDDKGDPNGGQWFNLTACLCNGAMYFGLSGATTSDNKNGTMYNWGDEDAQLPIMQLSPDEKKNSGQAVWLRDVSVYANSQSFAFADSDGTPNQLYASTPYGVRAFFLID